MSRTKKSEHITPVLRTLHWLPVKQRITFQLLLLAYKILHNLAPSYLSPLLELYEPQRRLRSSDQLLLKIPLSKLKSYGDRTFSVAASKAWNLLPMDIKLSQTTECFKTNIKTFLFKQAYE